MVKAAGTLDLKLAERAKWQIAGEYVDHGISGAKSCGKRPEFDRLIKAPTRRQFDVVMAWSVDRLGRSLQLASARHARCWGADASLCASRSGDLLCRMIRQNAPALLAKFQLSPLPMLAPCADLHRETDDPIVWQTSHAGRRTDAGVAADRHPVRDTFPGLLFEPGGALGRGRADRRLLARRSAGWSLPNARWRGAVVYRSGDGVTFTDYTAGFGVQRR